MRATKSEAEATTEAAAERRRQAIERDRAFWAHICDEAGIGGETLLRERVIQRLAEHRTPGEIALAQVVTESTVRSDLSRVWPRLWNVLAGNPRDRPAKLQKALHALQVVMSVRVDEDTIRDRWDYAIVLLICAKGRSSTRRRGGVGLPPARMVLPEDVLRLISR